MIQLRWFREFMTMETMRRDDLAGTPYDYGGYHSARLQSRYVVNPMEHGLHDPLWSEWEDVPIVRGDAVPDQPRN